MVQFSPFAGWRYDLSQVGDLSEVTAPATLPIADDLVDELYQRHPCNAVRLVQNRQEPGDKSGLDRCVRADDFFRLWKHEGILFHEHEAAFYVCQQTYSSGSRQVSAMSVIGRLQIVLDDDPAVRLACSSDDSLVREFQELLLTTGAQFAPLQALAIDTPGGSDVDSAFSELAAAVQGLTPLQISDTRGVTCRIWPLTCRNAIAQLQRRFAHCHVLITSGIEHYAAARQICCPDPDKKHLPNLIYAGNPPQNFQSIMVSLCSAADPGFVSLPTSAVPAGAATISAVELRDLLQDRFQLDFVGSECTAAEDACELAGLNQQQPAVALGTCDGSWFVVSALVSSDDLSEIPPRIAARNQLAAEIQSVLDPRHGRAAAILLPAIPVEEVLAASQAGQALPAGSFRLFPAPSAGLVYDSLT